MFAKNVSNVMEYINLKVFWTVTFWIKTFAESTKTLCQSSLREETSRQIKKYHLTGAWTSSDNQGYT